MRSNKAFQTPKTCCHAYGLRKSHASHVPEEREYSDVFDQIREVLIHENYMPQKDIEICLACDLTTLEYQEGVVTLHQALFIAYGAPEETVLPSV